MAFATARLPFSLSPHATPQPSLPFPKPTRTQLPISLPIPKPPAIPSLHRHPSPHFALPSVDVSKEDKPIEPTPTAAEVAPPSEPEEDGLSPLEEELNFDKRRLEEKFAVLNTGIYECRSCGYRYDRAVGDPSYPIPPGLDFAKLPEDWRCPTCGAAQSFFASKSVEIAGFAENQQFGLGGNTLTSGQKAVLIYGTLFLFFVLFLSGYFLQ